MTAYDSAGRPIQAVDPAVATAGIIGAGILGYSLGNSNNENGYPYRRSTYDPYYSGRYDRRYYFRPDACGPYVHY